jgi:hypothetical protein
MRLRLPDALPPLSGWVLVAYRVLWCAAAVLAVATLALGYHDEVAAQRNVRALYDLGLIPMGVTSTGQLVQPFSAQAKRLFNDQETLLAVNGRALPADMEGQTQALAGPDGAAVSVELMRADGSRQRMTLTRSGAYLVNVYAGTGMTWVARRWIQFGLLKDEREALAEIADPVARAIRIVTTRQQRETEQFDRIASVERGLAGVLDQLAMLLARTPKRAS